MEENGSRGAGSVISSFLLGGLIGAGVALLLAPKSGSETREQIRGFAGTARERADDYYSQVKEAVNSTLENARGLIDEKKRLITDAVQAGFAMYDQKRQGKSSGSEEQSPQL